MQSKESDIRLVISGTDNEAKDNFGTSQHIIALTFIQFHYEIFGTHKETLFPQQSSTKEHLTTSTES